MALTGRWALLAGGAIGLLCGRPVGAQDTSAVRARHDSVSIRFVESDLRAVVTALGRYLEKPVLIAGLPGTRVTLETPGPVPRRGVVDLLRGVLGTQGFELVEDSAYFQIRAKPPEAPPPAPRALPVTAAASGVHLEVIRLRHARAADVAGTINLLFGGSGAFSGSTGLSNGTLSDELRRQQVPPAGTRDATAAPSATGPASASFHGEVVLVPDERTNSLLVRASPTDFELLKAAVDQLDIRPLQVLIEVLIVEARHDRNFSLSSDLLVPAAGGGAASTASAHVSVDQGLGQLVLRLMGLGKRDIDAVLFASERKGNVKIISRPVILASNNTEARFLVGTQRPFVQVQRLLNTDNNNADQVVQYRDVGTKLTVRPTINQDGYLLLQVRQEVNSATGELAFNAPVISTREAETQVLVRDSQTVVIGGLRDQQQDQNSSGVPILSGIPILGGLFGSRGKQTTSTELYIFLTPRILRTDDDMDQVTVPRLGQVPGHE